MYRPYKNGTRLQGRRDAFLGSKPYNHYCLDYCENPQVLLASGGPLCPVGIPFTPEQVLQQLQADLQNTQQFDIFINQIYHE
jgi:hypothetical protein